MKVFFEGKKESLDVGENESCVWELGNGVGESWESCGLCVKFVS